MNGKSRATFATMKYVALIVCVIFTPSTDAQNIVRNGSFESLNPHNGMAYYWTQAGITGNTDYAPDGVNYAYIGSVSQTLLTTAGQSYTVSFYAAGDLWTSQTSTIEVDLDGQTTAGFTTQPHLLNPEEGRYEQSVWERFSTTVEASSTSTLLTFESIDNTYLLLDDVQMVAIPEPSAASLLLLGAFCLMNSFWRFKSKVV